MKKLILGLSLMLFSLAANAVPLGFSCISHNVAGDCTIGEAQLSGTLTDDGAGATFKFYNTGAEAMFIDGAYFYDEFASFLTSPAAITQSSGVSFSEGASPGHLSSYSPGALSVFYSSDADAPAPANGVNNFTGAALEVEEWVAFSFDYIAPTMFDDLLSAIDSGDLTFGLKVQGFETGGSETFGGFCEPSCTPVPVPGILGLIVIGLLGMVAIRRRM